MHKKKALIYFGLACIIGFTSVFTGGFFCYSRVCRKCMCVSAKQRYLWVPITTERSNKLSEYLMNNRLVAPQEHQWVSANGNGPMTTCAIGEGRYFYSAIHSDKLIPFLEAVRKHDTPRTLQNYLGLLKDTQTNRMLLHAISAYDYYDILAGQYNKNKRQLNMVINI